jgi:metal-responsive CopG/Arc/MetJ family transcriptional regulator
MVHKKLIISIDENTLARLDSLVGRGYRTRSEVIREAIREFLRKV